MVGCNSDDVSDKKESSSSEYKVDQRELTIEDERYISLLKEQKFDIIINETKELDTSNELKDYYYLASAFKKEEEIKQGIPDDVHLDDDAFEQIRYGIIIDSLAKVRFVPDELKESVNTLLDFAIEKEDFYTEKYDYKRKRSANEELQKKADQRTENPNGVQIGMTKEEVLTDGWGRPIDVNKTTTANGTREQWVYDDNNYLYFEDDVLTTIQN